MTSPAITVPVRTARTVTALVFTLAAALAALAIGRGYRFPRNWAATQAQLTCDLAPKRCGFGTLMQWLHIPIGQFLIFSAVSTAILIALFILVGLCAKRSRLMSTLPGAAIGCVLAANFGAVYLANLNGYVDILLGCFVSASVLAPQRLRAPLIVGLAALGVMMHEEYLVAFLPAALLPLILSGQRRDLLWGAGACAVALGLTFAISFNQPMSADGAKQLWQFMRTRVDFPMSEDFFLVMVRSTARNFEIMRLLMPSQWWREEETSALLMIAPAAVIFVWAVAAGWAYTTWKRWAAIPAALAPLAMNLVGWDIGRWAALCVLATAFALCALTQSLGPPKLGRAFLIAAAAAVAVELATVTPFLDQHGAPPEVSRVMFQP